MAEENAQFPLEFMSAGVPDVHFDVRQLRGRDALSRLYHFDLVIKRKEGTLTPDQVDAMLRKPCALSLGFGDRDIVHGILERLTLLQSLENEAAVYRARVVPNVWLLTLSRSNRIFQKTTVADMVKAILEQYSLSSGKHFKIMIQGGTKHDYIVQYEESDWDFIQRWLEYEGYFYWFEHDAKGETLMIADQNDDTSTIAEPSKIRYRDRNNLSTGGDATIWDWTFDQKRIPARVAVVDHNYRMPHVRMVATSETDAQAGFGSAVFYGEHFKDTDTGQKIADRRAEHIVSGHRVLRGTTDCGRFRVGHTFELEGHFNSWDDGVYLITAIDHAGGVKGEEVLTQQGSFNAFFECIPIDVPFRPERLTPWPRVKGVMHAHIDADGAGEFAQLDEVGRYKVRMPFDAGASQGTSASRWIRMAQPYSGSGYGSHFPLHKGTEVLIAHIDGNPDRPIIVGSVPCAHTPSPSNKANASQSVIQTASGLRIEMEDSA